ncbi:MAG: peptidogalycan biosysnthesis protein, partial [Pseudomonadota bacterium]
MTDATPGESHGCPDGKKQGADTTPQAKANETAAQARVLSDITEIDAADWDACAAPHGTPANPFLSHAFLSALEDSASVTPRTGWLPQHIVLEHVGSAQENGSTANQPIAGVLPLYLKAHSRGEFVFDYAWADAFERAGGDYYPKLLSAVPFSPVTGRRFLVRNLCERDTV